MSLLDVGNINIGPVSAPIGIFGLVGAAGSPGPISSFAAGRASIEIDGQRVPFSAEGIEKARLARCEARQDSLVRSVEAA
jgi:hypothetical protein